MLSEADGSQEARRVAQTVSAVLSYPQEPQDRTIKARGRQRLHHGDRAHALHGLGGAPSRGSRQGGSRIPEAARLHSLRERAALPRRLGEGGDGARGRLHIQHVPERRSSAPSRLRKAPAEHSARSTRAGDGLPTRWCGSRQAGDLPDSPSQRGRPVIKAIYAYPADLPGRFGFFADLLQSNASQMARFAAEQSGQRKALRFDMGSSCGRAYLDIQVVALRHRRADYLYSDPAYPGVRYPYFGQEALYRELQAAIEGQTPYTSGYQAPVRNFLVYIDGLNIQLNRQADGSWQKSGNSWNWGAAGTYIDESPDPYSQRNVNPYGQIAAIYGSDPDTQAGGYPVADPSEGFMPAEDLHEVFHTLGAVQNGAPHATGYLHCTDGHDVMCYEDSSQASSAQQERCPSLGAVFAGALDCDRDDYFNPSPPPGSYLASRWNTYSSPFLGSCRELLEACGGTDHSTASDQEVFDSARANAAWSGRGTLEGIKPKPARARLRAVRSGRYWRIVVSVKGNGRALVTVRCRRRRGARPTVALRRELSPPATIRARLRCRSRPRAGVVQITG